MKFIIHFVLFLYASVTSIVLFSQQRNQPYLVILGTLQDAGSPHMGCKKKCCELLFDKPIASRKVVSVGIVDPQAKKTWIIEATPDFPIQAKILNKNISFDHQEMPDGIFLSHAHIGHYAGLMYLGKESVNSNNVPVYAMTRMKGFLIKNGPWNQLVNIHNIQIKNIDNEQKFMLSKDISIIPFLVPHRDEFSETVGFKIIGPNKSILFIPDIDKWNIWNKDIISEIKKCDLALIDGTFYDQAEVNYRDISQIPHPFVIETMTHLSEEKAVTKSKILFIHLNHTNPLLNLESREYQNVINNGFNVAKFNQKINL